MTISTDDNIWYFHTKSYIIGTNILHNMHTLPESKKTAQSRKQGAIEKTSLQRNNNPAMKVQMQYLFHLLQVLL